MKNKNIILTIFLLIILIIPSINALTNSKLSEKKDIENNITSNNIAVKILRPKPGYLYLFDTIELPIQSQTTIIIGDITCVAEQIPVYPYTVKWEFTDSKYGYYKYISDNVSNNIWRITYSNFNFGNLEITASFENTAGTAMSTDQIIVKKYL